VQYWSNEAPTYIYYDRIVFLFNIYAFSPMHSTFNASPELTIDNCNFEYFFDYTALINVESVAYT